MNETKDITEIKWDGTEPGFLAVYAWIGEQSATTWVTYHTTYLNIHHFSMGKNTGFIVYPDDTIHSSGPGQVSVTNEKKILLWDGMAETLSKLHEILNGTGVNCRRFGNAVALKLTNGKLALAGLGLYVIRVGKDVRVARENVHYILKVEDIRTSVLKAMEAVTDDRFSFMVYPDRGVVMHDDTIISGFTTGDELFYSEITGWAVIPNTERHREGVAKNLDYDKVEIQETPEGVFQITTVRQGEVQTFSINTADILLTSKNLQRLVREMSDALAKFKKAVPSNGNF